MKDNQAKYPQLRFKGFTYPWEKRYLGDYVVDYTEKTTQENQFPVLTSSQQQGIVLQSEYFSDRQVTTDENIGYFVLPRGYFTYRSRSDNNIFVFNRNDIIDKGIISYFYPVFGLINVDSNFFLRRINNGLNRQLAIAAEGTGQHVLSLKKFKKMETRFPSLPEQKQIGEFLECLDDLITVNQRKLAKLKELKQGYLQKLFPKNGSKFPQLRFSGFADAWEERKSKDLFTPINERNREDLPVLSVTQDQGVVLRNDLAIDIKYDKSTLSSYKVIHPGDFVISLRSFQGGFELSKVLGISSPAYTIFDLKNLTAHNKLYWKYIFKSFKFIESLKTVTFGIRDGKSISFREFSDLKINYPSDVSEQEKIGSFFKRLDYTIALHQRKLEKLQELKKGYLQKMFC